MPSNDRLKCSFCGKTQDQVKKLIAGPDVFICDECVDLCSELIEDELDFQESEQDDNLDINLLKPVEIKEFLDENKKFVHLITFYGII